MDPTGPYHYSLHNKPLQTADSAGTKRPIDDDISELAEKLLENDTETKKHKYDCDRNYDYARHYRVPENSEAEDSSATESPPRRQKRERSVEEDEENLDEVIDMIESFLLHASDDGSVKKAKSILERSQLEIFPDKNLTDEQFKEILIKKILGGINQQFAISICKCPKISDWTLFDIGKLCPWLQELSVDKCPRLTDAGIELFAGQCRAIRIVHLNRCYALSDQSLEHFGKYSRELREFSATDCHTYTLKGFKALLAGCKKLEKLDLSGCTQVNNAWIKALITSECDLTELTITGCPEVTKEAFQYLYERFPRLTLGHEKNETHSTHHF